MTPIVQIENNIYHMGTITNKGENSMYSKDLFDVKFDNLKNTFIIPEKNEVYEFVKSNENLFHMLNFVKPKLNKYFNDFDYLLCIDNFPMYYDPKLALILKSEKINENAEFSVNKLSQLDREIRPVKRELGLIGKFFITF
jgi:hypothetical protein